MKRFVIVVTCILLCFIFVFTCIGYAAISDTLQITGNATATPPEALFISSVSGNGLTSCTYSGLFLQSSIDFSGGSVTLEVLIMNNTGVDTVYYEGYKLGGGDYNNGDITVTINSVITSDGNDLKAGQTSFSSGTTCTVNLTLTKNGETAGDQLAFGITFMFIDSKSFDEVLNNPAERFEQILNNPETFNELVGIMNPETNESGDFLGHDGSYIGNVPGANEWGRNDGTLVNNLFCKGNDNGFTWNGEPASVMVKFQNIDGNINTGILNENVDENGEGCEMVLYVAITDDIKGGGFLGLESIPITVYASVFTYENGSWVQLDSGDSTNNGAFVGEAYTCSYSETIDIFNYNSFDTSTWTSSSEYYGAVAGSDITTIVKNALSQ